MAFDKNYPNRKDKRRELRGSKRFDRTCRNHGSCSYCEAGRLHKRRRDEWAANDRLREAIGSEAR